ILITTIAALSTPLCTESSGAGGAAPVVEATPAPRPMAVRTTGSSRALPVEVASCDLPAPPPRREVRTSQRLVYATEDGRRLHLDVTRPVRRGPHPAVVLLHGGGWRRGNRTHMANGMRRLSGL